MKEISYFVDKIDNINLENTIFHTDKGVVKINCLNKTVDNKIYNWGRFDPISNNNIGKLTFYVE